MDPLFGMLGSTSQSTPKPRDHSTPQELSEGLGSELDSRADRSLYSSLEESDEPHVSDDSGLGVFRGEVDGELQGDDSTHFSSLRSRVDQIARRAQDLVEKTNERRTGDQEIIDNFQEKLTKKVSEVCQQMKEQMFSSYDANSQLMESRLMELSETLGRSSQLITELQGASQTLAAINKGLCK